MDNQNNEIKEQRVTQCIADRFAVMYETDMQDGNEKERDNFAHNCALALDFIGAGKIANGECYDLMLRAINNEFKDEAEIKEYISHIRAERKPRTMSEQSKIKSNIKKLLKVEGITSAQIAMVLNLKENDVNEIIKSLNK